MAKRILGVALALALAAAATATAQVLYVGDSLGVGTAPELRARLGGVSVDVDAKTSRPSSAGLELLAPLLEPGHEVVVFDLGTNDDPGAPGALAANLAAARELAGDRCLVVATLNRPPLNGVPVDGLNRAIAAFSARDPGTRLVDWHAAAAADPGLLTDGVHADPAGYERRGELFANAVSSCLAAAPAGRPVPGPGTKPSSRMRRSAARPPEPKPRLRPVDRVAAQLARAIVVGAEYG